MVLTASHHLVDDAVAAPDAPNGRRAVADDFDGAAIASGLIAVGEEIGDVQAEVPGDLLQPAQRDSAAVVFKRRERRGRHADGPRLLTQAQAGLDAQTADALANEGSELVVHNCLSHPDISV